MPIESPYTKLIVPAMREVKFSFTSDPATWLDREFRTIEIGPLPQIQNKQANELITKAVGILCKKPEEIFVGRDDWPFGLDNFGNKRPCIYAGVAFYLACDLKEFFACL